MREHRGYADLLSELGRATTAYHDAPIDRVEDAREEYLEALRNFNLALEYSERFEQSETTTVTRIGFVK